MKKFLCMMLTAVMIAAMAGCTKEEAVAVSNEAVQVEDVIEEVEDEKPEKVEVSGPTDEEPTEEFTDELTDVPTEPEDVKDEPSDSTITAVIVEEDKDSNRPTEEFTNMTEDEKWGVLKTPNSNDLIDKYNKLMVDKGVRAYNMGGPIDLETAMKYNIGKKNEVVDCATFFSGANGYPIKWYQDEVPIWELDKVLNTFTSRDGTELVLYKYQRGGYTPLIYEDRIIPSLNDPEIFLDEKEIKDFKVINSRGELIANEIIAAEDMEYDFEKGEKIIVSWTQGLNRYEYIMFANSVAFFPESTMPYMTLEGKVYSGDAAVFDLIPVDLSPGYYYVRGDYVLDDNTVGIDACGFFRVSPTA